MLQHYGTSRQAWRTYLMERHINIDSKPRRTPNHLDASSAYSHEPYIRRKA